MKAKQTDLATYELLTGDTQYEFEFPAAPSTELLVDVFADRPASLYLHIVKGSIDRWVNVVPSERRIEFRGRFANCVGARLHCAKECVLNVLVIGHPVGVDPIDYTPRTAKLEPEAPTMAQLVAREVKKLMPQRPQREVHPDPELMGDEIAERNAGFEIDDDDPLDPLPGIVLDEDDAAGDPRPADRGAGTDTDRGSASPASSAGGNDPPAAGEPPASKPA